MKKFGILFFLIVIFLGVFMLKDRFIEEKDGEFELLISDAPADIEEFEYVKVTFSHMKLFIGGGNESQFEEIDLTGSEVDLTKLIGENATSILEMNLEPGSYSKIELYVESVEAKLLNGSSVEIKIPSGNLKITKSFEIKGGEKTQFVFDINVVKTSDDNYNLLPAISESGVVGKDLDKDKVKEVELY